MGQTSPLPPNLLRLLGHLVDIGSGTLADNDFMAALVHDKTTHYL